MTRLSERRRRRAIRRTAIAAAVLGVVALTAAAVAPSPDTADTATAGPSKVHRPIDRTTPPATTTPEATDAHADVATTPAAGADAVDRAPAAATTSAVPPRARGTGRPEPTATAGGGAGDRGGVVRGEPGGPPAGGDAEPGGAGGAPRLSGDPVVDLTNARRAEFGCAPLVIDPELVAAAQGWVETMAATDDGADGQLTHSPGAGVTYGENIASGQTSPEEVVQAWMDSPGHRANILDCDYTRIGTGYTDDDTGPYWSQTFGL